ncbi:MAG: hypothetical protein ACR2NO_07220 [Chloroflexota bacterium]
MLDDVDRALSRLTHLPAPRGFTEAVMRAVGARQPARLSVVWLAVGAVALLALTAFGVVAGQALVGGGLLALLGALAFEDGEVLRLAPLDTALIALELVPWIELAGCALALIGLGVSLRRVASSPAAASAHGGVA